MAERLPNNITVNLSDEDRALLTKIADLLTRKDDTGPAVPESIRRLTELDKHEEDVNRYADQDTMERHMQKQDCSWSDAWNYFRDHGYDMSRVPAWYEYGDFTD